MKVLGALQQKVRGRADVLLIASESNISYVTGKQDMRGVIVVPAKAEPFMLTSVLEKPRAEDGIEVLSVGRSGDIRKKNTLLALKHELERRGIRHSTVAVEKRQISASLWERASRFTKRTVDFTDVLSKMRAVKSADEIRKIRAAAGIADAGIRAARETVCAGITEHELARELEYAMRKRADWFSFVSIVGAGPNSAIPHHTVSDRRIRAQDLVVVDIGAVYKGYCSDMTRTLCLRPGRRERALYKLVSDAHRAAVAKARPGVSGSSVDRAARSVIGKAGYEVPHSIGHGVGIDVHEAPSIAPGSKDILRPGMVFTIEPGVYIKGYGGARLEDMILLTPKGKLLLTKSPRCL